MSKSIIKSKTFWFNLIIGGIACLEMINPLLLTALCVKPEYHHQVMTVTGTIVAMVNIMLRYTTDSSIVRKSK